jgi:serine-protein kinase ATM
MSNLNSIRLAIQNGSQTARTSALQDLIEFFHSNSDRQAEVVSANDDGNLHKLIEAIFHCTLSEKQAYYSTSKKTAKPASATRLSKCAEALRTILEKAGSNLKRKTIRATIDHITQTLPGPEGTFVDPLIQDYVKAFRALLDRPSVVELIAAVEKETWLTCVDFASDCLSHYFAYGEQDSEGFRQSPLPSTGRHGSLLPSTGRSSKSLIRHTAGEMQWRHVEDILASMLSLVAATNAPTHLRAMEISTGALQVLQLSQRSAGQSQQIAMATLTEVFLHIQIENVALSKLIAKDVLPMLGHWWQSRGGLARDAFTHSLRDEILRLLFAVQLHLEALAGEAHDETFSSNIEDLLDVIWQEYSKREERGKLQLDDLSLSVSNPTVALPSTTAFHMKPNHVPGEQRWATIQVLAILESIFALTARQRKLPADEEEEGLPRKRRRLDRGSGRLHDRLTSLDIGIRLTALQLVPFLLGTNGVLQANTLQVLETVSAMILEKQSSVASWAMLACIRSVTFSQKFHLPLMPVAAVSL